MAESRPGTELLAHLVSVWSPMLLLDAVEEEVVTRHFSGNKDFDIEKFGNLLTLRKIAPVGATTLAATDNATGINYTANTEQAVTISPTFKYGAVQLDYHGVYRLLDGPSGQKYQKAYRTQIIAGIVAAKDADGGTLATSLSNSIGGSGQHLIADLIIEGIGVLVANAKNRARINRVGQFTPKFLEYHPDEIQYVYKIPQITESRMTGQKDAPTRTGHVWDAWGLELSESGNVYKASGICHNLLHTEESHAAVWNIEPHMRPVQEFDLAFKLIGAAEYGVGEVYDAYGVDIMTG